MQRHGAARKIGAAWRDRAQKRQQRAAKVVQRHFRGLRGRRWGFGLVGLDFSKPVQTVQRLFFLKVFILISIAMWQEAYFCFERSAKSSGVKVGPLHARVDLISTPKGPASNIFPARRFQKEKQKQAALRLQRWWRKKRPDGPWRDQVDT